MAAPATTDRVAPVGILLEGGFSSVIAFERDPNVSFWEKSVQPLGMDGGDPVDNTTMHNTLFRTLSPRVLILSTEMALVVAYDPIVLDQIRDHLLNQAGSITVHWPEGSTVDFFGYLRTFVPQPMEEGNPIEANITIQPTNWDPVNHVEQGPVVTEVAGT